MKITAIRATPVNLPLEAPYIWALGEHPGFSKTVVEVETDQGLTGLGEAPSHGEAAVIDALAKRLVGTDALDIAAAESRCLPEVRTSVNTDDAGVLRAFGAIELALWDLRGKLWDVPLVTLLGGAVREAIPFTDYFAYRARRGKKGGEASPEAVADACQALNEAHGTTFFEGKLSFAEPGEAIAVVRALRERLGPGAMIRLDSNMAYSLPTAVRIAREIEPFDIRNWEEPVGTFEEMAKLRRHTAIPFSAHLPDLARASGLGAPDALVVNIAALGGIGRTCRFVAAAEQMGIDVWFYSGDGGIMTAAYLHLAAALHHIREPSQSLFRWQALDIVEGGPFQPKNNVVPVPRGPGLGVTLDRERLDAAHRLFVDEGPLSYYVDPALGGRYRRLPIV
jgi:glucarate dehydratase